MSVNLLYLPMQWFSIFLGAQPKFFVQKSIATPVVLHLQNQKSIISKNKYFLYYYLFTT